MFFNGIDNTMGKQQIYHKTFISQDFGVLKNVNQFIPRETRITHYGWSFYFEKIKSKNYQFLISIFRKNNDFNKPSPIEKIQQDFPSDSVMLVPYDSVAYAKKYKNKAIKKTLSIPEWLNEEASKRGVNFSQVLQEALINKIK